MITSIDVSQEIFAMDILKALKIFFEVLSQACSATVTTIWGPGLKADFLSWQKSLAYSLRIFEDNVSLLSTLLGVNTTIRSE